MWVWPHPPTWTTKKWVGEWACVGGEFEGVRARVFEPLQLPHFTRFTHARRRARSLTNTPPTREDTLTHSHSRSRTHALAQLAQLAQLVQLTQLAPLTPVLSFSRNSSSAHHARCVPRLRTGRVLCVRVAQVPGSAGRRPVTESKVQRSQTALFFIFLFL